MPEGLQLTDRNRDPYAWALEQAQLLRRGAADDAAVGEFLVEWADEMLSAVRSQLVNLMAHAAKAALSGNPEVVGHWRSECIEFHDRLVEASFADHGEPQPRLPTNCPFTFDQLIDPDLDLDRLIAGMSRAL